MKLAPGEMVTPKIRLVRELGAGGMGSVWVAHNLALELDVAVKFIAPHITAGNPAALERFKREATVAAKMKSPHIVQIFDHGVVDGTAYIVMELLDGESLQERMAREGPLPVTFVRRVVEQTCRALSEAHRNEVVHRDIKPDNIFLSELDGEAFVRVLDFGIAKANDRAAEARLTATTAVAGTPHYMSPEQFLSTRNVTGQADLWSLAVVIFEALSGVTPWVGDTVTALGMAICTNDPPSIHDRQPGLPLGLGNFFKRALAKDPNDRFQTAKELKQAFDVAVESVVRRSADTVPLATLVAPSSIAAGGHASTAAPDTVLASPTPASSTVTSDEIVPPLRRDNRALAVAAVLLLAAGTVAAVLWRDRAEQPRAAAQPEASAFSSGVPPTAAPAVATTTEATAPSPTATTTAPAPPSPAPPTAPPPAPQVPSPPRPQPLPPPEPPPKNSTTRCRPS